MAATEPTDGRSRRGPLAPVVRGVALVAPIAIPCLLLPLAVRPLGSLLAGTAQPVDDASAPGIVAIVIVLAAAVATSLTLSRLARRWVPAAFQEPLREIRAGDPPVIVACPKCRTAIDVTAWAPGARVRCGGCRAVLRVTAQANA